LAQWGSLALVRLTITVNLMVMRRVLWLHQELLLDHQHLIILDHIAIMENVVEDIQDAINTLIERFISR
jgi:nucleoside-triphosphatase THEP1